MFFKRLPLFVKICAPLIILSLCSESVLANNNSLPSAISQSYFLNQNTSLEIELEGSDADGDEIEFLVEQGPLSGTLTGDTPNLIYVPNEDFFGEDSFTYKTNDSISDSEIATISFEVTQVNNTGLNPNQGNIAPECRNAVSSQVGVIWPPDHAFTTININGVTDSGGDVVSTVIQCIKQDEPLNSTGDGSFIYDGTGVETSSASVRNERKANSNGRFYHISYIATDAEGASCGGSVQVIVPHTEKKTAVDEGPLYDSVNNNKSNCDTLNINNPPSALDQSVDVNEDEILEVNLSATDPDQNEISYILGEAPLNGTLSGDAPNVIYTPNPNYHGSDSFTFKVNDGKDDSNTATVVIAVNPVNDAPTADNQSLDTNEDADLSIMLSGGDIDSDIVIYTLVEAPSNGLLTGDVPNLVYTPNPNFNGEDSFTFKTNDGLLDSEIASITINVIAVNDQPVAQSQTLEINEDTPLPITLTGNDIDNDSLTFLLVSPPSSGTLSGEIPNLVYTPNDNYNGSDSLSFMVNDGVVDSTPATIFITVKPVNDLPTVDAGSDQTVIEDSSVSLSALASDIDGQIVSQQWTEAGEVLSNILTLDINTLLVGTHTLTITVTDNEGATATDNLIVTVEKKPNITPIADDQTITTDEDIAIAISLSASDADGDALSYSLLTNPANGLISGLAPNLTYTPTDNYNGTDSFTFKVNDGTVDSEIATVLIVVNSINDFPAVDAGNDQTFTEGDFISITAIAEDTDGSITSQQWSEAGQVLGDSLSLSLSTLFTGEHTLTITVTDNEGGVASDSLVVTVMPKANEIPVAESQSIVTDEDTSINITLQGTDADGDTLEYAVFSNPKKGILSGEVPNLLYTPNANYNGMDSFGFTVNDGKVLSLSATVSIIVNPNNDAPLVDAGTDETVISGSPVTLNAMATDSDGSIVSYEWRKGDNILGLSGGLVLTDLDLGEHTFNILVTDNEGLTATDNVTINIIEDSVVSGRLSGRVLDKNGVSIPNAKVTLSSGQSTVSNSTGAYSIISLAPVDRSTVTAAKNNFLRNSEIVNIKSGKETLQDIILSRPDSITTIDTLTETVIETNGMTVTLPSGEYTNKQGEPINGEIQLLASYFPITTEEGINEFPGDTLAENNEGVIGNLTSFGFIKLELTDDFGNEVIIPEGGQIELSIPADDSLDKPETIPLWSFDEEKGLWIEEGVATYDPVTNTYKTTVYAINTFNLDVYRDVIASLDVCIEDSQGNKVAGYVGIESVDKTWRSLFKTSDDGQLRLGKIIGEIYLDIKAGADDGRLGEYLTNPYYLAAGANELSTCIVVDDNNKAEIIQVVGSMIDKDGNPQPGINISVYGDSSSQFFGSSGSIELTTVQTDSNGIFTLDFNSTNNTIDETALEVALFGDKEITIKVIEENGAKGEKVLTLIKGQNNYNLDSILLSPNARPVANAGLDKTAYLDEAFTFNANKSYDPDDFIRTYEWRIGDEILGQGKNLTLYSFAYAGFGFGKHNITLTVTDEFGLKASDDLFVTVIDRPKHALFADAGLDKTIYLNETIAIEGGSLSIGSEIYYKWTEGDTVLGEGVRNHGNRIYYEGTELGVHTIKLTVTNTHGLEEVDEMKITVVEQEHFLFADAGIDRTYYVGDYINFVRRGFSIGSNISSVTWKENGVVIDSDSWFSYPTIEVGVHHITLTLTNHHGLEASDDMTLTILSPPPTRVDEDIFLKIGLVYPSHGTYAVIKEIHTTGGVRVYNWTDNGVYISNRSEGIPNFAEPGLHIIKLTITDFNDLTISDEISVFVEERPKGIHADTGKDKATYLGDGVDISGYQSYSLFSSLSYSWAEDGVELSAKQGWTYYPTEVGLHTVTLTVTDGDGLVDSDKMTVLVTERREDEIYADAGKDKSTYIGVDVNIGSQTESYTLNGNLYYSWSEEGIELTNNPTFNFQSDQEGSHTIKLTVTDSNGLVDTDEMVVNVHGEVDTINPIIALNGEENITILQGDIYTELGATAIDNKDGVITTSILISNPIISTYRLGTYTILYTVQDQAGNTAEATRNINIVPADTDIVPPVITLIGENPATIIQGTEYNDQGATVLDNRDGSLGYSFDTNVNSNVSGIYQFIYKASDKAGNTSTVTRTVRVTDADGNIDVIKPVITLIGESPISIIMGSVYLDKGATAFDNIEGDITSKIVVDNTVDINTLGSYQVTYTVIDNANNEATISRTVNVNDGTNTAPVVTITNPVSQEVTTVTEAIDIKGSITDDNLENWTLSYRETGLIKASEAIVLAQGTNNVDNQVLATLDPTQLLNGLYEIILKATDTNGVSTLEFTSVLIDGDLKVGNFSISFEDLSIPTAGIPLTITRTYDTRQRHKSLDFGQGWSLGYENIRIQENHTPGFGWQVVTYPSGPLGLIPNYCIETNNDNIVTVILADGKTKKFQAITSPACNQVSPIFDVNMVFEAIGDDNGAKLEALDGNSGRLVDGSIYDIGVGVIDPTRYKLTTEEGREFIIDQKEGIREIYEPEGGNRITITQVGITHSAGPTVDFERDAQDRITKITSSNGQTLKYSYDTIGNLTAFTNRADETTTFSYLNNVNLPHYLEDITDPRGIRVARNEYDDSGRLTAHIDADGNRIEYTHDITGRTETIKNRLGHSTTYIYDERGNILAETNAEGETITHGYDQYGNELSTTDALGNTQSRTIDNIGNPTSETDALGNTSTSTYGVFNQYTSETDALGRTVIDNFYDNADLGTGVPLFPGPLTRITDALGNRITLGYTSAGINRITDVAGNITRTEYNGAGFVTASIDALGNRTDYTVDSMGNRLSETTKRTDENGIEQTQTSTHVYDAKDNLIQSTDANGNVTKTTYSAINKIIEETDAKGNKTTYSYDNRGNQTLSTYADGTTSSISYDAENNKLSDTDRKGETTSYTYDKANRLIKTTYSNSTTSQTEYDDAGRVSAEINRLGKKTTYGYDAAGRRTSVSDANSNTSTYAYDAVGNQTSFTDANSNKITYSYDDLDRRTKTTFADGTSKTIGYDKLGRKISQTDQADITTNYAYDALGRLTKVTDVQSNETSYTYDEQGNKISQTDAEGRVTKWSYDKLGRQTSRTLPLGQVETFTYDANGNLINKTDFNGQTSTFVYDVNNRLTKTTYADGQVDEQSYDANGNRTQAKITDSSGTRTYLYTFDTQSRLNKETQADGTTLEYQYDNGGNRTQLKTTKGTAVKTTSYPVDNLSRLASVTDISGTTTYSYDAVGNRSKVTHSNGNTDNYVYDSLNRLTSLSTKNSAGTVLSAYTYSLDATGKRTKIVEATGRTTDYTYDNLNRLKTEIITDATNGNYSAEYTYDKVGNRTYETKDGVQTQYTVDDNDRLSQQGGTTYSHDNNGNTLTETLDGNSKNYTYNAKNQLTETSNAGSTTRYRYNADGIREAQTTGLETTQYVVDSNRAYAQVIEERPNNTITVDYTYGDDLLSQTRNGTTNTYHYDGLGSTRALSDSTGTITDKYNYEAFGEVLSQTGVTINDYLFAGEQFDQNLDQYYLRARYYDQGIGRFTQQDTWMGNNSDPVTLHKYLYGNVDPINHVDPSGYISLGSLSAGMNVSATLSRIATLGVNAAGTYGKVDVALTIFQARSALMRVTSLIQKGGFDATIKADTGFANALANSDEAMSVLGAEFGNIFRQITSRKEIKQFISGKDNDMLIYAPTPLKNPWFSTGTRIPLGKMKLGKSSRKILVELGKSRKKGGRFTGLGHTQGGSKANTQWFRMDWHNPKGHNPNGPIRGNYHFHYGGKE